MMSIQNLLLFPRYLNSVSPLRRCFLKIRTQYSKMSTTIKINNNDAQSKNVSYNVEIRVKPLKKGYLVKYDKVKFQKGMGVFPNSISARIKGVTINSSQLNLFPLLRQYNSNQERLLFSHFINLRINTKTTQYFSTFPNSQNEEQDFKNNVMKKLKLLVILFIVISAPIIYKVFTKGQLLEGIMETDDKRKDSLKIPQFSKDIPDDVPFVLIGGGTASFSAFRAIKTFDPKAKVLILTNECHYPYMRPPLSKELIYVKDRQQAKQLIFKQWNGAERSIFFEPDEFFTPCEKLIESEYGGLSIARGWVVLSINPSKKVITLEDGKEIKYGKCLLATGSSPRKLHIVEKLSKELREKITYYRSIQDYEHIDKILDSGEKSVAIYGGGFLGSELAAALSMNSGKNLNITQIVRGETVLEGILPRYLSEWVKSKIEEQGVVFINNANLETIGKGSNGKIKLNLANNKEVEVDHLLVCIGSEPNVEIAKNSGLETDPVNGGIVANAELMARSDLYVAGDCVSYYDPILKLRRSIQHHDHAVISGRTAGENMFGAAKPLSQQSMFWSEVGFNLSYEGVGEISSDLPTFGIFASDNKDTQEVSQDHQLKTNYKKGIIFYLKENVVVGVLLWNIFNKIPLARQVIAENKIFEDLNEVAKLFKIHSDEEI